MRKIAALLQKDMRLYGRKMLSSLLLCALLLCGTAAALAAMLGNALAEPEPLRLALADSGGSAFAEAAVRAIADSDGVAALFTVERCDEAAARAGIAAGDYDAALLFSENYLSRILAGESAAVTVCLSDRLAPAADTVTHFAKTGETLIRVAEYGVMSAWQTMQGELPHAAASDAINLLELRYALHLLSLPESVFAVEVLPAAENGVGLIGHYLLVFLVFFLLLTEVLFFPFTVRDFAPPMLRRITSYGIRPAALLAEKAVLPFFLRFVLLTAVLLATAARLTSAAVLLALGALLLCSLLCTALSVLLSQSRLGIALLFAVATAGLLADGGLIPRAMLPYAMTQAGRYLPSGLFARMLAPLYGGAVDLPALFLMAVYTALAILGACLYAKHICRKGGDTV